MNKESATPNPPAALRHSLQVISSLKRVFDLCSPLSSSAIFTALSSLAREQVSNLCVPDTDNTLQLYEKDVPSETL